MLKITKKYFIENILDEAVSIKDWIDLSKNKEVKEFTLGKNSFFSLCNGNNDDDIYRLKAVQKKITLLLNNIELNNAATAYRKGKSYFDFLLPHKNNYNFLKLDIKSFFHSINITELRKIFSPYFENVLLDNSIADVKLVDFFINIITHNVPEQSRTPYKGKTILPMGFITSPVVSNIFFRQLDILIQKFCSEHNIVYSRYSDDILFSESKNNNFIFSDYFYRNISVFLSNHDLKLNKQKTKKRKHTISLNGYIIQSNENGNEIRLSNKKLGSIKKILYLLENNVSKKNILNKIYSLNVSKILPYQTNNEDYLEKIAVGQLLNKVLGYRSFILSSIGFNNKSSILNATTIDQYLCLVSSMEKAIDKLSSELTII